MVIVHSKYQESQRIAIFLSMPDEIQTEEIIKDIFKQGKECFIPRYKPHSNHMDMLKLSSAEDISSLPLTSWNIHQPSDDDNVREEALSGGWRFCNPVFWGPMKTHVKKGKIRTVIILCGGMCSTHQGPKSSCVYLSGICCGWNSREKSRRNLYENVF
ncbi:5-formyltetrahydrofolate cyclo-ligase isoform X1 [Apteryx rowi]|uniref:5-formyltetrahydrofolate cyclo-ligase isoform X1 n=1 Tax=Apteryx rowi TaxID=308060 RepID=UPI000E1DCC8F|nr:5-formyltetrahydrofolate cyclo-ligase isoform X1 [Apteryx rowi]